MEAMRPRPSVYIPEFIAANQSARADNVIPGTRAQQVQPLPVPLIPCHLFFPAICPPRPPHLLFFCPHAPILRVQRTWETE